MVDEQLAGGAGKEAEGTEGLVDMYRGESSKEQ